MTLRIAMVGACPFPVPQGSQVFLRDNALALQRRGHEVHLVVYGFPGGGEDCGLRVHRAPNLPGLNRTRSGPYAAKPVLDLLLAATLRRVVRRERIDIVFAHNYEALLAALLAGVRPLVYHAHNVMSDELPYYVPWKGPAQRLGRWLDHTFPRRADHVCVPHQRLAGHLVLLGCDPNRVSVVPPPMDAGCFEAARVRPEIPPVVYAGNLDPYQNIDLLFRAMNIVRQQIPQARLLIGTAEKREFEGAETIPVPNFGALRTFLGQDAVFAVPRVSWSGYPIKVLNAMASGLGIVACESAAYPLMHEDNGLVVPDNDVQSFADALLRLLSHHRLRAQLGHHARKTIEAHFQPSQVAQQLEAIAKANK